MATDELAMKYQAASYFGFHCLSWLTNIEQNTAENKINKINLHVDRKNTTNCENFKMSHILRILIWEYWEGKYF